MQISRHRTALQRTDLSRPIRLALKDGIVSPSVRVFDYGCGRGDDVARLRANGIACDGWDPVHRPEKARQPAEVVNLGYVINVIEDPDERAETLRAAWSLAERVLVVSGRLAAEARPAATTTNLEDGYVTRLGTFQKLYQQNELQTWVEQTVGAAAIAAGPGVFYVFRDDQQRESFLAARCRRRIAVPRIRGKDVLYERHKELLKPLLDFLCTRGRLPEDSELASAEAIRTELGSVRRGFQILRSAIGTEQWAAVEQERTQDLLVYLALARFGRRPRFSELPPDVRLDMRAFFTGYQAACDLADALLLSVGQMTAVDRLCRKSPVGKRTPNALYVHSDALPVLALELRLYEGCARAYIGSVEGANIVKLSCEKPQVSYLAYPDFDADPHPALVSSLVVPLQTFRVELRVYSGAKNPPILHRKEEFVPADYPMRAMFERLTRQEEAWGLYAHPERIGTRDGWAEILRERKTRFRGHRLVRAA